MKHGHGWRRSVSNPKASPVASNGHQHLDTTDQDRHVDKSGAELHGCSMGGGPDMVQRILLLHALVLATVQLYPAVCIIYVEVKK